MLTDDLELRAKYTHFAGGALLVITFFMPFYEIPLISSFRDVSGLNILRAGFKLDFIQPSDLNFKAWLFVLTPIIFSAVGVAAFYRKEKPAWFLLQYALFCFGYVWYSTGNIGGLFSIASVGFYVGLVGAVVVVFGESILLLIDG